MLDRDASPIHLYLPLLTHEDTKVREQTCAILLSTYGDRALTYLRRLLDDSDMVVRHQARQALIAIGEMANLAVELRPFRGMYVECLGRMRVYIGSREVQPQEWMQNKGGRAGWRKVQSMFAYLIHCGHQGVSRSEMGDAVWGTPVNQSSFARTLSSLRHALAQVGGEQFAQRILLTRNGQCALDVDAYHTDIHVFERTFDTAYQLENEHGLEVAVARYEQVVRLYGGAYMSDVPVGNDWARQRRDLLANNFVIAVERLAEHAWLHQSYQRCITVCQQALYVDETAEDVMIWLLRAYQTLRMRTEYEHAYQHYLRAAELDPRSEEGQSDSVVQFYATSRQTHKQSEQFDSV